MVQKQKTEKREREKERPKVGYNNVQLCIATPPRVADAKPPGPKDTAQESGLPALSRGLDYFPGIQVLWSSHIVS